MGRLVVKTLQKGMKETKSPAPFVLFVSFCSIKAGLKPVIVTSGNGVSGAAFLLDGANLADRVDVLDAGQFLTANVYERSLFQAAECHVTLTNLFHRYNELAR